MSIISLTVTESSTEIVSGIPKSVSVETNIPSTIFYTLDGSDPTIASLVYIDIILLPTNQPTVTLKLFATNGTDSSAIIEQIYNPNISGLRQAHDQVFDLPSAAKQRSFGFLGSKVPARFGTFSPKSLIVDKPDVENIFDGYDGTATGTTTGGIDLPLSEYEILFSETNTQGEKGRGIGTLPSNTTLVPARNNYPDIISHTSSALFNPKARVIIQDSRKPPFDNVTHLNGTFFSLENSEIVKDGNLLFTTAIDGLVPTGSLVRSFFNQNNNTITYYYFDSATLRWIISTEPFTPKPPEEFNLYSILFSSRARNDDKVFRWIPFTRRHLR